MALVSQGDPHGSVRLSAQNPGFWQALEWADTCEEVRENQFHLLIEVIGILRKVRPRYANKNAAIGDHATTIPNYVGSLGRMLDRRECTAPPAFYEVSHLRILAGSRRLLLKSIFVLSSLQIGSNDRQI